MKYYFEINRLFAALFVAAILCPIVSAAAADKPNVIFILVDDLGWTDLGCFGSDFHQTPRLNKLAAEGMKFTNAYSACTVCSPTRAAVMTGRYPARLHLTDWIAGHVRANAKLKIPDWTAQLELDEITMAEMFKAAGYATCHVGKWHLGPKEHWPEHQGFDVNIAGYDRGQPPSYYYPYKRGNSTIPNLEPGKEGQYLTDRLSDEVANFIRDHADKPFFIYVPYYTVHTPIEGKKEYVEEYQAALKDLDNQPRHNNAGYAAMVRSLDEGVGTIVDTLDELKLTDNTIIVFTSDNGGLVLRDITDNTPLRAGKGSTYEGGVRVPAIVRWPGKVEAGSECSVPVMSIDYLPTLAEACGLAKTDKTIDGQSLMPLLNQKEEAFVERPLYWHYPHYHPGGATPYSAIRSGDYKLIEFFEDGHLELYNLAEDIGETTDLAAKMPEKTAELHKQLEAWRKKVDAQLPTKNPAYKGE